MNKQKEMLKREYDKLNDEELIDMLEDATMKYVTIQKSTKIAKKLMKASKIEFIPLYDYFMVDYCLLIAYCNKRGIQFPKELLDYEIDNEDVVERLTEQETLKMEEFDNYLASYQEGKIDLLPIAEENFRHFINDVFDYMISKAEKMDLTKKKKRIYIKSQY